MKHGVFSKRQQPSGIPRLGEGTATGRKGRTMKREEEMGRE